jgi:flagellar hook assembly protein FlgD
MIRVLQTKIIPNGYTLPPVTWNGNDDGGQKAGKGLYPYTVTITTVNGEIAVVSGRMIIL